MSDLLAGRVDVSCEVVNSFDRASALLTIRSLATVLLDSPDAHGDRVRHAATMVELAKSVAAFEEERAAARGL